MDKTVLDMNPAKAQQEYNEINTDEGQKAFLYNNTGLQANDTVDETTGKKTYGTTEVLDYYQDETPAYKKETGNNVKAYEGAEYSWDTKAKESSNLKLQSDVLDVKKNSKENASALNTNLVTNQEQADMMKYTNNQQAEKVGWTGGYVLDQNRQMDYLKASIAAQMYGAIELQKYGYDTALAAARLSYDLNQETYAMQYYQQAVENAARTYEITGVYKSAEVSDMLSQLHIAQDKLNDATTSEQDKETALKLRNTILDWFTDNNISPEGVKGLSQYYTEVDRKQKYVTELWTRYNDAVSAAKEDISNLEFTYLKRNADGTYAYNDAGQIETINFSTMSIDSLVKYAKENSEAINDVEKYFAYKANKIVAENTTVNKDTNKRTYDEDKIKEQLEALQKDVDKFAEGYNKDLGDGAKFVFNTSSYIPGNTASSGTDGSGSSGGSGGTGNSGNTTGTANLISPIQPKGASTFVHINPAHINGNGGETYSINVYKTDGSLLKTVTLKTTGKEAATDTKDKEAYKKMKKSYEDASISPKRGMFAKITASDGTNEYYFQDGWTDLSKRWQIVKFDNDADADLVLNSYNYYYTNKDNNWGDSFDPSVFK